MRHSIKAVAIFLSSFVVLMSCTPVTLIPTTTVESSATVVPTDTSISKPSVTATPNIVNAIFPVPTFHAVPVVGALPQIATPVLGFASMKLKGQSEKDFFEFIQELNKHSYDKFPPMFDWWSFGAFIDSQESIAIAIQEFLYRYPNSPYADELHWRLAFINAVVSGGLKGNQYGDEWMLGELEKSLENQIVEPDKLENILRAHSFDVVYVKPVDDLFVDNRTAWLYQIVPQIWQEDEFTANETVSSGSLFFVVREINKSDFKLYLLKSAWSLYGGESSVFDISDHNENGRPEIALYIGYHSGTMCRGNLLIFEWVDGQFGELTQSEIRLRECSEGFTYSQSMDIPLIVYAAVIPRRTEIYSWNGQYYEWQRTTDIDPFELWRDSFDISGYSSTEEIEILRNAIESGEAVKFGPAFPDYLRYRIGIEYALKSKRDEAVRELQNLVSSPVDTTRTVFPGMAKEFLKVYAGDKDVYKACRNSAQVYENALDPYRDFSGVVSAEVYQDVIGVSKNFSYLFELYLCNGIDPFVLLVDTIPSTVENLPLELQKNGVDLSYFQKIDVNLDGKANEWLVGYDQNISFLVFPNGSYYHAAALAESIGYSGNENSSIQIDVEDWNGFQNPVMVIRVGSYFSIFEIENDYESQSLFSDFSVTSYMITNQNTSPQFQVFYPKPKPERYYPYQPWVGYRWDASQSEFREDLLEFNLFMLHDSETAARLADTIQPLIENWKDVSDDQAWALPYIYYLNGLSYELSGEKEKAAQIYWQLWHDFPESHFALLAKYKLEPINP